MASEKAAIPGRGEMMKDLNKMSVYELVLEASDATEKLDIATHRVDASAMMAYSGWLLAVLTEAKRRDTLGATHWSPVDGETYDDSANETWVSQKGRTLTMGARVLAYEVELPDNVRLCRKFD